MTTFVTHLEGAIDGQQLPADTLQTMHKDRPIWVRYDLDLISRAVDRSVFQKRPTDLWRYKELLPVADPTDVVTLGEGMSPLLNCPRLGDELGLHNVLIKDEGQMPTGSFKDRGQTVAISMARVFGIQRVAIPTAGNAGGSMAAYAARAGLEAYVFMPQDTPLVNQYETALAGARAYLVDGLITDCGKIVRAGREPMQWFDMSTLKEPYRIEGKKTMGLELAEQLNWNLPDVILYPTGGGTGLIGMWKAFQELRAMGWLNSEKMPRMVAVQSDGCCPVVRAFDAGSRFCEPFPDAKTIASGIRVPAAVGDFMILDAIGDSEGCAVAVDEQRIIEWMRLAAGTEGIAVGPESATCIGAAQILLESGWLAANEQVVIFNCGSARKYPDLISSALPLLQKDQPLDWPRIRTGR